MAREDDAMRSYAPLWSVLMGAGLALTKILSTRYLLQGRWRFTWGDALTAVAGALGSYALFRGRHGYEEKEHWYKR